MKAVAITANPEEKSLTNTVGRTFLEGFRESATAAERSTDFIWLDSLDFRAEYTAADRAHYLGTAPVPTDVAVLQDRIADADILALCFPIYWYTMPALMKSFFDRVLCSGFAFDPVTGAPLALVGKRVRVFMLTGSPEQWFKDSGIDTALHLQICEHTFRKYCGVEDVELVYVSGLTTLNDSATRAAVGKQLDHVREIGRSMASEPAL